MAIYIQGKKYNNCNFHFTGLPTEDCIHWVSAGFFFQQYATQNKFNLFLFFCFVLHFYKHIYKRFKPGNDDWFKATVTFFHPDKTVAVFVNGKLMVHEKTDYTFNLRTHMTIGRSSDLETEFFIGDISCVRIFGFVMSPQQIANESSIIENAATACPKGNAYSGGGGRSRYTVDGRLCLTVCLARTEVQQPENVLLTGKQSTKPALKITCMQTLSFDKFDGETGQIFRVK